MKALTKVLVVDDSSVMRKVLVKELLSMDIYESNITEAEDGREAIKAVLEKSYDLIIMDWNMPNILGIDAVKAIRGAGITTPIIMVTTEAEKENVIAAIQAGANNYLIKPFSNEMFRSKVSDLLFPPAVVEEEEYDEAEEAGFEDAGDVSGPGGALGAAATSSGAAAGDMTPKNELKPTDVDFDKGAITSNYDFAKTGNLQSMSFTTFISPAEVLKCVIQFAKTGAYEFHHVADDRSFIVFNEPKTDHMLGLLYIVYVGKTGNDVTQVEVAIKDKMRQNTFTAEVKQRFDRFYGGVKNIISKAVKS